MKNIRIDLNLSNLEEKEKKQNQQTYINFRINKEIISKFKKELDNNFFRKKGFVYYTEIFRYFLDIVEDDYVDRYKVLLEPTDIDMRFYSKKAFGEHYRLDVHQNIKALKFPVSEYDSERFYKLMNTYFKKEKEVSNLYKNRFSISFYFYIFYKTAKNILSKDDEYIK